MHIFYLSNLRFPNESQIFREVKISSETPYLICTFLLLKKKTKKFFQTQFFLTSIFKDSNSSLTVFERLTPFSDILSKLGHFFLISVTSKSFKGLFPKLIFFKFVITGRVEKENFLMAFLCKSNSFKFFIPSKEPSSMFSMPHSSHTNSSMLLQNANMSGTRSPILVVLILSFLRLERLLKALGSKLSILDDFIDISRRLLHPLKAPRFNCLIVVLSISIFSKAGMDENELADIES